MSEEQKPVFTDRENMLIQECLRYNENGAPGLPGHALMVIIAKYYNECVRLATKAEVDRLGFERLLELAHTAGFEGNGRMTALDFIAGKLGIKPD